MRITKRLELMVCEECGKGVTIGNNRSHSEHKTKKLIFPNLQKHNGRIICTSCLKGL